MCQQQKIQVFFLAFQHQNFMPDLRSRSFHTEEKSQNCTPTQMLFHHSEMKQKLEPKAYGAKFVCDYFTYSHKYSKLSNIRNNICIFYNYMNICLCLK